MAKKRTVRNAQAAHTAYGTAAYVYCQRRYKLYVNAINHTVYDNKDSNLIP